MSAKRKKKPSVPPELRREWFKRYVEYGESYRKISQDFDYDQRTVKTHIEKALREADQNQARILFVKDNLEKHHQDLCHRIEEIQADITAEKITVLDSPEDLYLIALRRHLYRSALWDKLKTWNATLEKLENINIKLRAKIEKNVNKTQLKNIQSDSPRGVVEAAVAVLVYQVQQWSRGNTELNINRDWRIEGHREDKFTINYGFGNFGLIKETDIEVLKNGIANLEEIIRKWPEYITMKETVSEVQKLKQDLRIEFKGILIRRVIPGTCTFCPI
jgi:hypothetical protein